MSRALSRSVIILVLSIMTSSVVLADTIKREVTFSRNVVVNGTEVKKGTYDAIFDDQSNEVIIKKGKKVIVKAPAQLEKLQGKGTYLLARDEGDVRVITAIAFKNNQATILNTETTRIPE